MAAHDVADAYWTERTVKHASQTPAGGSRQADEVDAIHCVYFAGQVPGRDVARSVVHDQDAMATGSRCLGQGQ